MTDGKVLKRSFNWEVVKVNRFIRLAAMSYQRCLLKFPPINTRIYGHWEKCLFFKHPNLVSDNESKQHKMELISFHSPYCMPLYRVFKLRYVVFFRPVSGETPCRSSSPLNRYRKNSLQGNPPVRQIAVQGTLWKVPIILL